MTRFAIAVLLALLTITAGCSAGVLQDEGSTPTSADSSEEPSSTTSSTPTPSGLPPGVSESGVENETALYQANKDGLEDAAFVVTARTELRYGSSANIEVHKVARSTIRTEERAGVGYERHVVNNSVQGNSTTEVWSNGSVTLIRDWENSSLHREPQVRFRTAPSRKQAVVDRSGSAGMFLIIGFLEFDLADQSSGRVTLKATGVNRTALEQIVGENSSVTGYEAELVVDARGRISEFDGYLKVDPGEGGDLPIELIRGRYRLTSVGDVSVERPAWVETARAHVTLADVSIEVVDGNAVAVTNEGPDTIPAGVTVGLFEVSSGGSVAKLAEPVPPGETIYLYKPEDAPGPGIAREEPDEPTRELSGDYTVYLAESLDDVLVRETVTVEES